MELIGKLEQLTSRPMARQLRRQVYVLGRPRTTNETLYYAVDGIHTAISRDRQVSFRYFDWTAEGQRAFRREGAAYVTDPVALCVDRYYYLVAYDALRQDYRHYRVDRMADLTVLDSPRSPLPRDFDLGRYVRKIFDMYGGASVTVRLRLHRSLINPAMDRFGSDAHIRPDGPDHVALTAPVEAGPTFYGWLFQFGDKAELLSPADVRRDFADYCRRVLAQYETKKSPAGPHSRPAGVSSFSRLLLLLFAVLLLQLALGAAQVHDHQNRRQHAGHEQDIIHRLVQVNACHQEQYGQRRQNDGDIQLLPALFGTAENFQPFFVIVHIVSPCYISSRGPGRSWVSPSSRRSRPADSSVSRSCSRRGASSGRDRVKATSAP